jgi:acyl dehydratase
MLIEPARVTALTAATQPGNPAAGAVAPLVYSRMSVFAEPEPTPVSRILGIPPTDLRHAAHRWDVAQPLLVGQEYEFDDWRPTADEMKRSRTGAALRFVTFARDWRGPDGELALTERMTVVHAQGGGSITPDADAQARAATPAPPPAPAPPPTSAASSSWADARPDDIVADIQSSWLTRDDIARFGRLIGDLTAIHHDVEAARQAGLPDVIAMGMLPAALVIGVVEANVDPRAIRAAEVRFRRVVFPGELVRIVVRAAPPPDARSSSFHLELQAAGHPAVTGELVVSRDASA